MSAVLVDQNAASAEHTGLDDSLVRPLVRDLHKVNRTIFWTDLLLSCSIGWVAFVAAVVLPAFSIPAIAATAVSVFCLYRALCFVHEISHQSDRSLPGFGAVYNALVGFPFLMPSFVYVGVHQSHHKVSVYGTEGDPEYLPFAQSWLMTTTFALESFFIPAILLLRFLVLTPIGLISSRFHRWLVVHASSLTMNVKYRREVTAELSRKVRSHSAMIFLLWGVCIALAIGGVLPWRVFVVWFFVCSVASFINTLRTLGAHAYESTGEPMDRMAQLRDSIDTPGAFWTELWAPVGLRYHALHHYFPGIPYHNLPEAYRRLIDSLPVGMRYREMSSPGLPHSLRALIRKGLGLLK
ncbi:MAG: fatty acid desaturase family protein [Bryobacteraceae bacterium]